jgi:hypothetical protein
LLLWDIKPNPTETIMGSTSQGTDRQNQKPQPGMPTQEDLPTEKQKHSDKRQGEKKLGNDPAKEGESNESLPEGSANPHDLHSD